MKKVIFIIITVFCFFEIDNLHLVGQEKKNTQSGIESTWEHETDDIMIFSLFKNGNFILKKITTGKEFRGEWKYSLLKSQIILKFVNDKDHWNKIIFSNTQFLESNKDSISFYNPDKREVGFYIKKSDVTGGEYFDFLGYYFYKK
ncbi:hypothetical protein JW758_04645 [Candidatus Peregrinibacteria bacterium]|nr:hypothetical protein [Candidatus Peregrinibacteria bacterium]